MPHPIIVPNLGESIGEATILGWKKSPGDTVQVGDILLELETEKVNLEVGAEHAGVLGRIDRAAGADVKVGETIGMIDEAEQPQTGPRKEAARPKPKTGPKPKTEPKPEPTPAGPTAPQPAVEPKPAIEFVTPPQPTRPAAAAGERPMQRERMSRRRRTIAARLVESQHTAAMLTTFNEIDMSAVARIRARHKAQFEAAHGVKLGLLSFFVKAAVAALRETPAVNAQIDGEDAVYKYFYDIGIAVDTPEGLVVPVLRDADKQSFVEVEKSIHDLAEKARGGTLAIEDLRGGTFTITNGGVYGSLLSTPLLNLPQVAILGLHRIEDRAVVVGGEIAIRPMMYVALSYDHRLIDGRVAVQFLMRVKELVETPERLLVEG